MAVTNPDRVVTKQDLKDFYDEILPYLGGNLPVMGDIDRSMIYDTTEKVVGKWVDGRPVYQKVLSYTITSSSPKTIYITHNISNLRDVIRCKIHWTNNNGQGVEIPYLNLSSTSGNVSTALDKDTVSIPDFNTTNVIVKFAPNTVISEWVGTLYVVAQYTKTTDAANSFNYASENDYSTTEKVIGTWIDGSKIYQKTIDCGNLPNATTKNVEHGISGTFTIIDFGGFCVSDAVQTPVPFINLNGTALKDVLAIFRNGSYLTLKSASDVSSYKGYLTIKYVKKQL